MIFGGFEATFLYIKQNKLIFALESLCDDHMNFIAWSA